VANNRSTSLGYGQKVQIGQSKTIVPSPGAYELGSYFKPDKKKGISIGAGREVIIVKHR